MALIGFVGAGLGLLFGQEWWAAVAVGVAVPSLVAILPWVKVGPPGAWAGAVLDLLILAVLLPPWSARLLD